jgi:hypothetical protein
VQSPRRSVSETKNTGPFRYGNARSRGAMAWELFHGAIRVTF